MITRTTEVTSRRNKRIAMKIIQGHFATTHSHINYFLDMTEIKSLHKMAKAVAQEFANEYANTPIEAIVCTERTKMIGAFLAEELSASGINRDLDIVVITPEFNSFNQMLLRDNVQSLIWQKHVLLLTASITTGLTASSALDGVNYYGATPVGLATLFSTLESVSGLPIKSIFDKQDISGYSTHVPAECPLCAKKIKLDALVNSYGYSKL